MSELAINEFDNEWSAFALKDEYLQFGTKFEFFECAFCAVSVHPRAVYGDHFVKAPHFFVQDTKKHHDDCLNASGGFAKYGFEKPKPAITGGHAFEVDLPESLIPTRPRSQNGVKRAPRIELTDPAAIASRVRAKAGKISIENHFTTSVLKTVIDARNRAETVLKAEAKKQKLVGRMSFDFVNATMKLYPLSLYGTPSNYDSAFHKTRKAPWKGKYIYYGAGTVVRSPDGFVITSADEIMGKDEDAGKSQKTQIRILCDPDNPLNLLEGKTIAALNEAIAASLSVDWYAYGAPAISADGSYYSLPVERPEHIYISK